MSPSESPLRLAIAQNNYRIGDLHLNFGLIEASVDRAREAGADLLVLSECALLGYPPRDLVEREEVIEEQLEYLERVASLTDDDLGVVLGYIDKTGREAAKPLRNAAALCYGGQVQAKVYKRLLPTYDVFDEDRYFEPGHTAETCTFKGVELGISICEDAWNERDFWERPLYPVDPIAELAEAGAEVMINVSASPFHIGKGAFRRRMMTSHADSHNCWFVLANQVGGHDELIFDGRSVIIAPDGTLACRLAEFEEDFCLHDIYPDLDTPKAETSVAEETETAAAQARKALVLGIRDYVHKTGFNGALIGLSGGIDSAVTCALAAEALGPENILGVSMPSQYSSEHSKTDAQALAENLGIEFDTIPIEHTFNAFLEQMSSAFEGLEEDVTEENIQARIRGTTLMALSNKFGKLVLAPSNKSESSVGYTTLYGDMVGALCVIGDCYKQLVYDIAREINAVHGRHIVPEGSLTKPPSAELRPGQVDEDSLPAYEVLDPIVRGYMEEGLTAGQLVERGYDTETIEFVLTKLHQNEYKRWQAPPILKIRPKAFGVGWRYPLAASYHEIFKGLRERLDDSE
ncbi:MAG: NAD+ synthase [Myxococcota bacterium]